MDSIRTLRDRRASLEKRCAEIMEMDGSIDEATANEFDAAASEVEQLDRDIRSSERAARMEAMRSKPGAFTMTTRSESRAEAVRDEGYRFVREGQNIRVVEGREAAVDGVSPSSSLPGMPSTSWGDYSAAVPVDLQSEIIRRLPENRVVRNFFSSMNYQHDIELQRVAQRVVVEAVASHDGSGTDGAVSNIGESVAYPNVDMELERVRSNNFKSAAKSSVTEEFLRDARGRAVAELLLQHAESHSLLWDAWYAGGSGGTNGPQACFDGAEAYIDSENQQTISLGAATTAGTASATWTEALTQLRYDKIPAQYWGGLRWMMSQECFALLAGLLDKQDRPIFSPLLTGTLENSTAAGTILGLPVFVGNNLPGGTPQEGNTAMILAHENDYRIFDRTPFSQLTDPYSEAGSGMVRYLTRMRSDGRWLRPFAAGMLLWGA